MAIAKELIAFILVSLLVIHLSEADQMVTLSLSLSLSLCVHSFYKLNMEFYIYIYHFLTYPHGMLLRDAAGEQKVLIDKNR
jgi:hypothetical protein